MAVRIQIQSESERDREFFGRFSTGRLASFGAFGPRSSDLVIRADRTTSGFPAAKGERRSGALGGALCEELAVA